MASRIIYIEDDGTLSIVSPCLNEINPATGNNFTAEEVAKKDVPKGKKYKDLEEKYRIDHIKRSGSDDDQHSQIYQELMDMLKEISIFIDLIAERLGELETVE